MALQGAAPSCGLIDGFGRRATYLRLSVTDRCGLRCVYCMSEDMTFRSRRDILSLEELIRLARLFIARGIDTAHHRRRAAGAAGQAVRHVSATPGGLRIAPE